MVSVSSEVIELAQHLLLGFVAAWVFYGLTTHPRLSPFERVVQALIFTALIRLLIIPTQWTALAIGKLWSVGKWSTETEFIWSSVVAVFIGHVLAWCANSNWYHSFLYRIGVTSRTSHPSPWFTAFHLREQYILLHLDGGRRLKGWPYLWPDSPDSGHFVLQEPAWVLDDNTVLPVLTDDMLMIRASDVSMVDFVRDTSQLKGREAELAETTRRLVELQKEELEDEETDNSGRP